MKKIKKNNLINKKKRKTIYFKIKKNKIKNNRIIFFQLICLKPQQQMKLILYLDKYQKVKLKKNKIYLTIKSCFSNFFFIMFISSSIIIFKIIRPF
jgi:hypothetical protein